MNGPLDASLSDLKNSTVEVAAGNGYPEAGQASIDLRFTNGARLRGEFWRLIVGGKPRVSSFDHQQQYGLPTRIDAVQVLHQSLQDKLVTIASLNRETFDLLFEFSGEVKLQVFCFTGYEIWEFHFPNGYVEYSNHVT
jgi:hypothetical protein